MPPTILDTDILIDILTGGHENVRRNSQRYLATHGRYTITSVTIAELSRGSYRRDRSLEAVDALLGQVETLPLDAGSARLAGQIFAALELEGQTIGFADSLIAAIAITWERALATANVRHFARVASLGFPLQLVNWREEIP